MSNNFISVMLFLSYSCIVRKCVFGVEPYSGYVIAAYHFSTSTHLLHKSTIFRNAYDLAILYQKPYRIWH